MHPPSPPPLEPAPVDTAATSSPEPPVLPEPAPLLETVPETTPRLISDVDLSKIPEWMLNPEEAHDVAPPTPAERPPAADGGLWRETVEAPMRPPPEPVEAPSIEDDPLERARRILQAEQRKREAAESLEALEAERVAQE